MSDDYNTKKKKKRDGSYSYFPTHLRNQPSIPLGVFSGAFCPRFRSGWWTRQAQEVVVW